MTTITLDQLKLYGAIRGHDTSVTRGSLRYLMLPRLIADLYTLQDANLITQETNNVGEMHYRLTGDALAREQSGQPLEDTQPLPIDRSLEILRKYLERTVARLGARYDPIPNVDEDNIEGLGRLRAFRATLAKLNEITS